MQEIVVEPPLRPLSQQPPQHRALEGLAPREVALGELRAQPGLEDPTGDAAAPGVEQGGGPGVRRQVGVPARQARRAPDAAPRSGAVARRAGEGRHGRGGSSCRPGSPPSTRGRGPRARRGARRSAAARAGSWKSSEIGCGEREACRPSFAVTRYALRRILGPREVLRRDPAGPLVVVGPPGHRLRPVAGAPDRVPPRALVADRASDVRVHEVLARTTDPQGRRAELLEVTSHGRLRARSSAGSRARAPSSAARRCARRAGRSCGADRAARGRRSGRAASRGR